MFKANFLQLWQPRASFEFLSNVWAKYRLTAHFKPEKVSSLIENVQPRPRGAFPGFRGGALHLQSQRKCQVGLNRARISAPNDSGGLCFLIQVFKAEQGMIKQSALLPKL